MATREPGDGAQCQAPMDYLQRGGFVPVHLLVIQPTPFCNLNCDYCYLPDRQSKRQISLDIIEHLFQRLFTSSLLGPRLSVVWHAGEPLVTPLFFYKAAFQRISALNETQSQVVHSIQTNGLLLTQEWCEFIKEHDINVGVSLDGPAFLHDAHRKTRAGRGTHERVMQKIMLLQRNNINFHVIAVLTRQALDHPDELFAFFVENGITRVGFNIEEREGVHTASSLDNEEVEERYRSFMRRMYELVKSTNCSLSIREFDWARTAICYDPTRMQGGGQVVPFNDQIVPFSIISVDCEGNFSTFSPELLGHQSEVHGDFVFGNVLTNTFESAITTEKFQRINQEITAGVDLCKKTCEYFELCGGAAPANKYFEHGSFRVAETMFCRYTIQTPIDIVLSDLEASLRDQ